MARRDQISSGDVLAKRPGARGGLTMELRLPYRCAPNDDVAAAS